MPRMRQTNDKMVRNHLFKEMTFRLTPETKLGAKHVKRQEKKVAEKKEGPKKVESPRWY